MRGVLITLLILFIGICAGCSDGKSQAQSSLTDSVPDSVALNPYAMVLWKAQTGQRFTAADIDTIVGYFAKADDWTKIQLSRVKSEAEFDNVEVRYQKAFPYLESYSAILEQYASAISETQLEELQRVALSMAQTVDSVAAAIGINSPERR